MRAKQPAYFDTNILIYAFAKDDRRTNVAEALLADGGVVGVQALNEFASTAVRKLRMPWPEVLEALGVIRVLCPTCIPVTLETHDSALELVSKFRYHIYDALMIAAALQAGCDTLYSEDLQDGQVIDGLTIRDPFR